MVPKIYTDLIHCAWRAKLEQESMSKKVFTVRISDSRGCNSEFYEKKPRQSNFGSQERMNTKNKMGN